MKVYQILIFALIMSGSAFCDDKKVDISDVKTDDLRGYLDLSVPEAPAFTALGITPENVITPGSQHDLALALLDGVDQKGNLQTGIAVEVSPYAMAFGDEVSLLEYKHRPITRILYNTKLSFATSSGSSDADKADRKSIGIRFSLWNFGDLRVGDQFENCVENDVTFETPPTVDVSGPVITQEREVLRKAETSEDVLKAVSSCTKEATENVWNQSSMDIGLAYYDADDDTISESGYSAWASVSFPLTDYGQVIIQAKYFDDALSPDVNDDDIMDIQDGNVYSARVKFGRAKFNIMMEASVSDVKYKTLELNDDYNDILVGTEFEVTDGIWLQFAYGRRSGSSIAANDEDYLSGQIRWAVSESSLLN
tara:strand:- start:641 stop:1738 length:1098 start_codon:yes stop_codon:yes gene_type:complete